MTREKRLGLLLLLALGITLPFVGQAFHIDDPNFIAIARQIARDPWRPYSFSINWLGREQPAFEVLANPPLVPAYIALVIRLSGENEIGLHLAFIPIALLATWGVWRCAKCFVRHPGMATALYVVTPAFVVSSHTLMPDIALMALASHAVASFVPGFKDHRPGLIALGATLAGLAFLTRYSGLILIPLFLIAWWLHREGNRSQVAWVAIPIGFVVLWSLHNLWVYGTPHLLAASSVQSSAGIAYKWLMAKAVATVSYLGGGALFPLALFPIAWSHRALKIGLLWSAGLGGLVAFITGDLFELTLSVTMVLAVLLTAAGVYLSLAISALSVTSLRVAWRGRGGQAAISLFLAAWLGSVLLFNQFLLFAAVRYLLPAVLPAILLLVRAIEEESTRERAFTYGAVAGVLTLALSLGLSVGELKFAEAGRQAPNLLASAAADVTGTPWFVGHWGFQYYMERAGARALDARDASSPKVKDLVVVAASSAPHSIERTLANRLSGLRAIEVPSDWPLRTISPAVPAFFHANSFPNASRPVFLPYGISSEPMGRYLLFLVRPE